MDRPVIITALVMLALIVIGVLIDKKWPKFFDSSRRKKDDE